MASYKKSNDPKSEKVPSTFKTKKEEGNKLHNKNKWPEAVEKYSEAIAMVTPDVPKREHAILYSNRAASYKSMNKLVEALADGTKAIVLDKTYWRAYTRCASVHEQCQRYKECIDVQLSGYGNCDLNDGERIGVLYDVIALNLCRLPEFRSETQKCLVDILHLVLARGYDFLKTLINRLCENDRWDEVSSLIGLWIERIDSGSPLTSMEHRMFACGDVDVRRFVDYAWHYDKPDALAIMLGSGVRSELFGSDDEPPVFGIVRLSLVVDAGRQLEHLEETLSLLITNKQWPGGLGGLNFRHENVADFISRLDIVSRGKKVLLKVLKKQGVKPQPKVKRTDHDRECLKNASKLETEGDTSHSQKNYVEAVQSYRGVIVCLEGVQEKPPPVKNLVAIFGKIAVTMDEGNLELVQYDFDSVLRIDPTCKEAAVLQAKFFARDQNYTAAVDALLKYLVYHGQSQTDNLDVIVEAIGRLGEYERQQRSKGTTVMITGTGVDVRRKMLLDIIGLPHPPPERLRHVITSLSEKGYWGGAETILSALSVNQGPDDYKLVASEVKLAGLLRDASKWIEPQNILLMLLIHGAKCQTIGKLDEPAIFALTRLWFEPVPADSVWKKFSDNPYELLSKLLEFVARDGYDALEKNSRGKNVADFVWAQETLATTAKEQILNVLGRNGVRRKDSDTRKQSQPVKQPPKRDPCALTCEKRYREVTVVKEATTAHRSKIFESLCAILEERGHHTETHARWVERSLDVLVDSLKKQEAIPDRIQKLPPDVYERLVLKGYPYDWNLVAKLLRPLKQDRRANQAALDSLARKLDLCKFIESDYLKESATYRCDALHFLLRAGLSAVRANDKGVTPLQTAARCRDFSCVKLLIENGADPFDFHFTDIDTPLHAALSAATAKNGDTKLLEFLLKLYKEDSEKYRRLAPDVTDENGDTLLHVIAKAKSTAQVVRLTEFLRGKNIDRDVKNKDGKRAQDYLALQDKRRRFLQGSSATTAGAAEPIPARREAIPRPLKISDKEARRQELNQIIESFEGSIIQVEELELSESESETESLADDEDLQQEGEVQTLEGSDEDEVVDESSEQVRDIEVSEDVFDNLEWEVECTADVWRILLNKKLDRSLKASIVKKIRLLASGEWLPHLCKPLRSEGGIELLEVKLSKGMRIVWEVAVAFSERRSALVTVDDAMIKERRIYAEIIRVWDIVIDHKNLNRSVRKIIRSNVRGQQSIVRKRLCGIRGNALAADQDNNKKKRLPILYTEEVDDNVRGLTIWTPPASSKENEYHIMKFYAVNTAMVKYILEHEGTNVDFPFNVTEIEYTYICLRPEPPSPLLILGRSGTGKTTCCLYRLWMQYLSYWDKAMLAGEPLLPRQIAYRTKNGSDDDDSDEDEEVYSEDEDEVPELKYDHLHQVFVTKNRVLTTEVRKNFLRLCRTNESAQNFTGTQTIPVNLQSVPGNAYPLFLTSRQFLVVLDGSLPGPYFKRDARGEMKYDIDGWGAKETQAEIIHEDSDEEEEEAVRQAKKLATKREVTYEIFAHKLWPKLKKALNKKNLKNFHPSLIWMEIISFIKGSLMALNTQEGYLSRDAYKILGKKQAPHFTADRDEVYNVFEEYRRACKRDNYFDECDVVHSVYHRLRVSKHYTEWAVHQIYVDEVQDFTQAELCLLIQMCHDPNAMFFTGDTAQSIMRGVAFRFSDLKTLFHAIGESRKAVDGAVGAVSVPKQVYKLTQNYRSHAGVIRLANSIITLLNHFFPHSFDHAKRDLALFDGPRPILFDSVQFEDLALVLIGNKRQSSQIEFGAHQAIIVVNDEARENIPDELSHCLILTVYESKGLEFDDVLLFNFFKDSEAGQDWRVVSRYLKELSVKAGDGDGDADGFIEVDLDVLEADDRSHPLDFSPDKHKILNSELKHLYTAITRARVNVWIYDENTKLRKPMFEYFKALGMVSSIAAKRGGLTEDEEVFVRKSSPQDWRRRGKEFYRRNQFKPAAKCFLRAGDTQMQKICDAHQRALSAQERPNSEPQRKDEFMAAAQLYLQCERRALYVKAATCLRNAKEFLMAAKVFKHIGKFPEAGKLFLRCRESDEAVHCFEQIEYYDEAVRLLCEQKRFQEAILVWKMYEQKIKDYERTDDQNRLETLRQHRPSGLYEKEILLFRVADIKLAKEDIEGVRYILSDLGWAEDRMADWMARKGHQKAAAVLLENGGKLMEAAALYREMNDYRSAISCLDRCKDLRPAKQQLADCYLVLCRRYYERHRKDKVVRTESSASDAPTSDLTSDSSADIVNRSDYREYMDFALKYYEELNMPVKLGECLLLEGFVEEQVDHFQEALDQFHKDDHEIGQIHSVYQMCKRQPSIAIGMKFFVLKGLSRTLRCLQKGKGVEYSSVMRFYGLDEGTVVVHSFLHVLRGRAGAIEEAEAIKIVRGDLLKKTKKLLQIAVEGFREEAKKVKQCPKLGVEKCPDDCPYLHQKANKACRVEVVNALKRLMMVHGFFLDNYVNDEAVRRLFDSMQRDGELDMNCWRRLVGFLMLDKPTYALDTTEVLNAFELIWKGQDSDATVALLTSDAKLVGKDAKHVEGLAKNTDALLLAFYSILASGEYFQTGNLKTLSQLTNRLIDQVGGDAVCNFAIGKKYCNVFLFCVYSFHSHYTKNMPFEGMKELNRFLEVAAIKSAKCLSLCPQAETIMPIFEFQFVRGVLLYLKANPFTPAFLPRSYLRVVNVFDALCSKKRESTVQIVDRAAKDCAVFHTTVRNQLRTLCEVFLGVKSKKFNMLKAAVRSADCKVQERVVVFTLVMLVNVGLVIDDTISFKNFGKGKTDQSKNKTVTVPLEEVIMRRLERLMNDVGATTPRLGQLFESVRSSSGLQDIAERLKEFVDKSDDDQLLQAEWDETYHSKLKTYSPKSHLEMDNKFIDYKPKDISDSYKILQEMDDDYAIVEELGGEEVEDVPEMEDRPEETPAETAAVQDDPAVDDRGCDICGIKFTVDEADSYDSRDSKRREHQKSAEHKNAWKIHKKYVEDVTPLVGEIHEKMKGIRALYQLVQDENPSPDFFELNARYAKFEEQRKKTVENFNWKASGVILMKADALRKYADSVEKKIRDSESYKKHVAHVQPLPGIDDEVDWEVVDQGKGKKTSNRK